MHLDGRVERRTHRDGAHHVRLPRARDRADQDVVLEQLDPNLGAPVAGTERELAEQVRLAPARLKVAPAERRGRTMPGRRDGTSLGS